MITNKKMENLMTELYKYKTNINVKIDTKKPLNLLEPNFICVYDCIIISKKLLNLSEEVKSGKIAPWFDQPGGGIQYQFTQSIEELIQSGYLGRLQ